MQLVTTRGKIKQVAERWKRQYLRKDGWYTTHSGGTEEVYAELCALDMSNCDACVVDTVIGNTSWTEISCSECGAVVDAVVMVEDHDDHSFELCADCLRGALELLEAQS